MVVRVPPLASSAASSRSSFAWSASVSASRFRLSSRARPSRAATAVGTPLTEAASSSCRSPSDWRRSAGCSSGVGEPLPTPPLRPALESSMPNSGVGSTTRARRR